MAKVTAEEMRGRRSASALSRIFTSRTTTRRYLLFLLLIAPAFLLRIVTAAYPILRTGYLSLTNTNLITNTSDFIGLRNFPAVANDFGVQSALTFTVMLVVGVAIRPAIILSLLPMLLLACFSLGIGLLISSLAIYFPDVVEMYQIILTAWFYLTPIVYPFDVLPEQVQVLMNYNPMYWLVRLFRITIYEGRVPTAPELFPAMILSLIVLGLGWWVFARKSDEFAYRT